MSAGPPILEIVIGREGALARLRVIAPACPGASKDWYKAQLDVDFDIVNESFVGRRRLVMFADDFRRFERSLVRFVQEMAKSATIQTGDFFTLDILDDNTHGLHAWIQLDAIGREDGPAEYKEGGVENWEWRIPLTPAAITTILEQTRRVTAHSTGSSV